MRIALEEAQEGALRFTLTRALVYASA
jgi:hypothetical protein